VLSTCGRELCVVAIPPFAEANVAQPSEADCRVSGAGVAHPDGGGLNEGRS
jgi:hypothetical protein